MLQVENKYAIKIIKVLSVIAIIVAKVDILLKAALLLSYILLFSQQKWHKHLIIMFIMLVIFAVASQQGAPL